MSQNPFEMPKAIRDMVDKNLEQSQAAVRQFSDAMTQAMSLWTKSMPAMGPAAGFQSVQDRAVAFAKQNAEAAMKHAGDLAKVKSPNDILMLQTQFAQSQMQMYAQQTQELGRLTAEAIQGMAKQG